MHLFLMMLNGETMRDCTLNQEGARNEHHRQLNFNSTITVKFVTVTEIGTRLTVLPQEVNLRQHQSPACWDQFRGVIHEHASMPLLPVYDVPSPGHSN